MIQQNAVSGPILYTRGSVMVHNGQPVAMFYVRERGATIRIWND